MVSGTPRVDSAELESCRKNFGLFCRGSYSGGYTALYVVTSPVTVPKLNDGGGLRTYDARQAAVAVLPSSS